MLSQYLPNIFQQKDLFQTFYTLVVCIVISLIGSENISIHWIPFELENSEIWKKDQAGKY